MTLMITLGDIARLLLLVVIVGFLVYAHWCDRH